MKKLSVYMLILALTVCVLTGCRRRNENETSSPSESITDTSKATESTPAPATTDSYRETEDNGVVDDMITKGSEIIDDILPDETNDTRDNTTKERADDSRRRNMPRY